MASLAHVQTFWDNADAHSAFLTRIAAALVEKAKALREEDPPNPVTAAWVARQEWANYTLQGAPGALTRARLILPALAVTANDAGLLSEDGTINATDNQIRNILTDTWIDMFTDYVPEAT